MTRKKLTAIGGTGLGVPGAPIVEISAPIDGARIGVPVSINATATPESGATVTSWEVTAYPPGTDALAGTVLASGTGALPASLATFDPTQLQNGLWQIRVEVTDDLGRTGLSEAALEVAGAMKLGSFDVGFLDAEWYASITPISLVRSYSTLRKDTVGDFGHGWALSMDDSVVQPTARWESVAGYRKTAEPAWCWCPCARSATARTWWWCGGRAATSRRSI